MSALVVTAFVRFMLYYSMGRPKKGKGAQAGQLESLQDTRQASGQEGKLTGQKATRLASRQAIHILLIVVIGFLAYSNSFYSPFQWDEEDYILENPIVRDLGFFAGPSRAAELPLYDGLKSRYIGYLTFALNYRLHGFNVFGYHVVNLVIHLINAILVYFLVLLTLRTPYFRGPGTRDQGQGVFNQVSAGLPVTSLQSRIIAFIVALLFVSHPIQTEAVTYIFQRFASLVSMFYLMSLVLYIKGRQIQVERGSSSNLRPHSSASALTCFILSFISAVLAMKTKENALTLPLVITLYEFFFFNGTVKKRLRTLAPFLMTLLIIPYTLVKTNKPAIEIISQIADPGRMGFQEISRGDYILTQFRVIVTYLRLLFCPVNQNLGYDYHLYHSFFEPPVFLSFLFLSALFGLALYLAFRSRQADKPAGLEADRLKAEGGLHYSRLIAFGILWFFITLSVESSIIPLPMVIDEYRVYLPSVGFFLALVSGVALLLKPGSGFSLHESHPAKVAAAVFTVIILVLAAATHARNSLWKDKVTLWEDVVSKSPDLPSARLNLGIAYKEAGLAEKAIEQYRIAAELHPGLPLAHMNMGNALDEIGRLDEAIKEYETALRLAPDNWQVRLNMGSAYGKKGWTDKAIEQLEAALKLNPYSEAALNNLGNAYSQKGEIDKAIEYYQASLKLKPDYADANYNIGAAYEQKGENDKAANYYLSALRFKPDYVEAHYNLGRVYVKLKRPDEAIEELAAAIRLSPNNGSYRNTLGVLYAQKGLYADAIEQFETAVRLAPDNQSFRRNLERAHRLGSSAGDKK